MFCSSIGFLEAAYGENGIKLKSHLVGRSLKFKMSISVSMAPPKNKCIGKLQKNKVIDVVHNSLLMDVDLV